MGRMTANAHKRPRDPNQLAKMMIDIAAGETCDSLPASSPMAELGRSGGGGRGGKGASQELVAGAS